MPLRPIRLMFLFAASLAILSEVTSESDDRRAEVEKLLQQVRELTDIRAPGSSPFRLLAHAQITNDENKTVQGSYLLLWKSPEEWRSETSLPDFNETRIARNGVLFISRKPSHLTFEAVRLQWVINFPGIVGLKVPEAEKIKVKEVVKDSSRQHSVEFSYRGWPQRTVFLDWAALIPTRVEFYHLEFKSELRLEDYGDFGAHQFPRKMVASYKNKTFIAAEVEDLAALASLPSGTLDPPEDSHWVRWCPSPEPARLTDSNKEFYIPDIYPHQLLKNRVSAYGIIGIDGRIHNAQIVKSGGRTADSLLLDNFARARYSPATCDGKPVETEIFVEGQFLP